MKEQGEWDKRVEILSGKSGGGGVKERGERVGVEKGSELGKELVIEGKEERM